MHKFTLHCHWCCVVAFALSSAASSAQEADWGQWYRPADNPVFTTQHGNNHDSILFIDHDLEYPYHLIVSHEAEAAHLWRAKQFSWSSRHWELVSDEYIIDRHYEFDDGVKVDGTYYIFEGGSVYTFTGALEDASGKWERAGTFPKDDCDDAGVWYEDGVFHLFGEYGDFPHGPDGTSLSHFTSPTGLGDWTLVNPKAVDPNPDGGHTYGVGDPTIEKIDGEYYIFCDRESEGVPYKVIAWKSPDLNTPFEYMGVALDPRSDEVDDWDNYRIQDADIGYIPELGRYVMTCNMKDHDGNPGGDFPTLAKDQSRVIGVFYSERTLIPETERDFNDYPEPVAEHLNFINTEKKHYGSTRPLGDVNGWQQSKRNWLERITGLDEIDRQNESHTPEVTLEAAEDMGDYTRQKGYIQTERKVRLPFWLLKPKTDGPHPLGIFPHGHDSRGYDTYAGVYHDDAHREKTLAGDRDVAVQAVKRGYIAIAPATRGLSADVIPDLYDRHGGRSCRAQLMHCLLAGRTPMGERVWDQMKILDWASTLPDVDMDNVLMMGNSGGGMVTLYAAALDTRIKVAVPSCSFTSVMSASGYIYHCDCNLVPGLLELGDLPHVAGLIAPRALIAVNGFGDNLHSPHDIERAVRHTQQIFDAADASHQFIHRWGDDGHRFYSAIMWPFIERMNQE